jgi:TPR repeat protein
MTSLTALEVAARSGDHVAAYELACLLDGEGIDQDRTNAIDWYKLAADLGNKGAAYVLGCKYRDGAVVEQDETLALKWFKRAADLGDSAAHMFLALVFSEGMLGQVPDFARARLHTRLAHDCAAMEMQSRQERRRKLMADDDGQ